MKQFQWLVVLYLWAMLSSVGQANEMDYGETVDGVFHNTYLGFSVTLPKDWVLQDQAAQRKIMKFGSKLLAGDDANLTAVLKASEQQAVNLFAVFQYPLGTPGLFNPSISMVAENVGAIPGIRNGQDYLIQTKAILQQGKMDVTIADNMVTEIISGQMFDSMHTVMKVGQVKVFQKYYAIKIKEYVLVAVLSFNDDDQATHLDRVLNTLVFD
ncbi:MAG: hypothetical protein HOM11_16445 [Methylococcales bacterium]|jgi:hypothetical protein|nr:hypothetical protein [Methylococcales bacterium]MBT7443949.1 hypothetical protein [Methylococcales bacterium]